MAAEVPEVSVIIVSWNTRDLVINCIRSIVAETEAACEIIIVDNASNDGTAQAIADIFPNVTVVALAENVGFARANNLGWEVSRGEYVLLLNPDTVVLEGAIDKCLEEIRNDSQIGVLGCQVWESSDQIQRTSFKFPGPRSIAEDFLGIRAFVRRLPGADSTSYDLWDRKSSRDVDVISGMFMLIPRNVICENGLFDCAFFIYAEEADFCFRLGQAGLRRFFWSGAKILHLDGGSKSTEQIRPAMYAQLIKSLLIFIRKNRGFASWALSWWLFAFAMAIRLFFGEILASVSRDESIRKRCAVWRRAMSYLFTGRVA